MLRKFYRPELRFEHLLACRSAARKARQVCPVAAAFPWILPDHFRFRTRPVPFGFSLAPRVGDGLDTSPLSSPCEHLDEPLL